MQFLRKLFVSKASTGIERAKRRHHLAGGMDADLPLSVLHETRPYVIAMREVAADTLRSC